MIAAVAVGSTLLVTSIHHGKANSDGCGRTPFPEGYRSGIRSTTKSLEYEPRDFGFGFQSYAITDAQLADLARYVRRTFSDQPAWGDLPETIRAVRASIAAQTRRQASIATPSYQGGGR